ncbi:MAG: transglycosylase domain-containing protein [Clostridia bacterium]|nr:transglycosylase domain-containing protein [Clostridia bacterium]
MNVQSGVNANGSDLIRPNKTKSVLIVVGKVLLRILSVVMNILLTVLLIGMITAVIVGTVFALYIKNYVDPTIDASLLVTRGTDTTTRIYYTKYDSEEDRILGNGVDVEIENQRLFGSDNSIWASYDQFPQHLIDAFTSIEDHRFDSHNGVDWVRTGNAVLGFFFGEGDFGGSTITQQLVKNLTNEDEPTIQRKVQEIFRALDLEKKLDKTEIMEMYLNIIFLSNNCKGVQAAANFYFGKDVSELNLVECASIAAIVKNPSRYEPLRHDVVFYTDEETGEQYEDGNRKRRNDVLWTMWQYGKITEAEYEKATSTELEVKGYRGENSVEREVNSWYTDAVFNSVKDALMEERGYSDYAASMMIYKGGLHIYTAMDYDIQTLLEDIYENDNAENFSYSSTAEQPESAMVITDPRTGDVLALVGGRGVKTGNRLLNRATMAKRPAGSSIKPISVYAPALDRGVITYGTAIDDSPLYFNGTTPYPKNAPAVYAGMTTIHEGIRVSKNTVAMKTLELLGIENSYDFMYNKLRVKSVLDSKETSWGTIVTDKALAPLGLGQLSYGLTVQEITNAYSIFVNDGIFSKSRLWTRVTDSTGNVILDNPIEQEAVISAQSASIMTIMLEDVVTQGTGAAITLKNYVNCAGKTGTTQEDYDRWFIGYTPYYVGGIWFGYDLNQSLSEYGENPAVLLWDNIMTKLHQKYIDAANEGTEDLKYFATAPGVITCTYCKDSGLLMGEACYADPRGSRAETGYFTEATKPTQVCNVHKLVKYCNSGGGVAGNDCPKEDVGSAGLLDVDRAFDYQVYINDAQYTCRDFSGTPTSAPNLPYYHSALGGKFSGVSSTDKQFNCFCTLHTNFDKYEHPEKYTTKADTTTAPPETTKQADTAKKDTESEPVPDESTKVPDDTEKPDTDTQAPDDNG